MSKIAYEAKRFNPGTLAVIEQAERICQDYARQGYELTLRQLYYRFVALGLIPNKQSEYKRLGSIVNDARLAGLIDWNHLVDRTRNAATTPTWAGPESIMHGAAEGYNVDKWADQDWHVEVWVEKEALIDVVARPARRWEVLRFACRGYVSQSEMWAAAMRLKRHERAGKRTLVVHLGDHDPSGIDMTRDIRDRLRLFGSTAEVKRIALTMDQVDQYRPPPNPAKVTDSRYEDYVAAWGDESWELDALEPQVLDDLVDGEIVAHLDRRRWDANVRRQEHERAVLRGISRNWDEVAGYVDENGLAPSPNGRDGGGEDE